MDGMCGCVAVCQWPMLDYECMVENAITNLVIIFIENNFHLDH